MTLSNMSHLVYITRFGEMDGVTLLFECNRLKYNASSHIFLAKSSLGGCTVLNMYEHTLVQRRGIDLRTAVLHIHTINTFKLKIFMYTYIKHIFKMEYIRIQRFLDI